MNTNPHAAMAAELERLREERDALRAALAPFATFADAWDRQPLKGLDDQLYTIHGGTEWEANLRLSHCRRARAALGEPR